MCVCWGGGRGCGGARGVVGGGGGQPLTTAFHIISLSLQKSVCEKHTCETGELKGSKST